MLELGLQTPKRLQYFSSDFPNLIPLSKVFVHVTILHRPVLQFLLNLRHELIGGGTVNDPVIEG